MGEHENNKYVFDEKLNKKVYFVDWTFKNQKTSATYSHTDGYQDDSWYQICALSELIKNAFLNNRKLEENLPEILKFHVSHAD